MSGSVFESLSGGFAAGTRLCAHATSWDSFAAIETVLQEATQNVGMTFGAPQEPRWSGWSKWWNSDDAVRWLGHQRNLPLSEAAELIQSSPIHIRPKLCQNAGDPRKILGVMALGSVAVLLYDTLGMSPVGAEQLHQHIAGEYGNSCVVHRMLAAGTSVRPCPPDLTCLIYDDGGAAPGGSPEGV